ncbi:CBS domain-containing protein [Candidatus Woesearchaeota archaeon]|nr:MAG: CBS domain-containing protein [Candidatus Woesearchaeota archaeon]
MFDITQLKRIRKQLNLTQGQFAKRAHVSQSLIAKIESGKIDPSYSKVKKIEEALNSITSKTEKCAKDIMNKSVISVEPEAKISTIIKYLNKYAISQILVLNNEKLCGIISESSIINAMGRDDFTGLVAKDLMEESPPIISQNTKLAIISSLLKFYPLIIVSKKGKVAGVITKADLVNSIF